VDDIDCQVDLVACDTEASEEDAMRLDLGRTHARCPVVVTDGSERPFQSSGHFVFLRR
jgi:hypothetical protein